MEKTASDDDRYLPDELIINILSFLPTKPLVRFRSVCKNWNHLISDPKFANLHMQRSSELQQQHCLSFVVVRSDNSLFNLDVSLMDRNKDTPSISSYSDRSSISRRLHLQRNFMKDEKGPSINKIRFLAFPCNPENPKYCPVMLLGSCHGLVCIHTFDDDIMTKIYLWNPLTNVYRLMKCPPIMCGRYHVYLHAFGFVPMNGYKIFLGITYRQHDVRDVFLVYSLKNDEWRKICTKPPYFYLHLLNLNKGGVLYNGAFYWGGSTHMDLLIFDLDKECFKIVNTGGTGHFDAQFWIKNVSIGATEDNNSMCMCTLRQCAKSKNISRVQMFEVDDNPKNDDNGPRELRTLFSHDYFKKGGHHRKAKVLSIASNGEVVIVAKDGKNFMKKLVIMDARRQGDSPSFIKVRNDFFAPHKRGGKVVDVVSYVQSLVSPFYI